MTRPVDTLLDITVTDGGGTFEAGTLLPFRPTRGYAVAMARGTAALASPRTLRETARRVAQEWLSTFIGTWVDPEGRIHVDPVQYVVDRDRAIALGRERGQLAIYDFGAREVIEL